MKLKIATRGLKQLTYSISHQLSLRRAKLSPRPKGFSMETPMETPSGNRNIDERHATLVPLNGVLGGLTHLSFGVN